MNMMHPPQSLGAFFGNPEAKQLAQSRLRKAIQGHRLGRVSGEYEVGGTMQYYPTIGCKWEVITGVPWKDDHTAVEDEGDATIHAAKVQLNFPENYVVLSMGAYDAALNHHEDADALAWDLLDAIPLGLDLQPVASSFDAQGDVTLLEHVRHHARLYNLQCEYARAHAFGELVAAD